MTRPILALLTCAAACAAPVRSNPVERVVRVQLSRPVVDSVPRPRAKPRLDLTGTWTTGSVDEPTERSAVLQLQCNYTPGFWLLEQRGDTVRAWENSPSQAQGIATPEVPNRPAPPEGRIVGNDVTLKAGATRYVLHYDAASGHLRGTLDGAPFWAMRLELISRAEGCIPVP